MLVVDRPDRPVRQCTRLRALAEHPSVALVCCTPLVHQYPLNDKLYYPVYATCAAGLPVSVNVGVPGPRVRSACQHPELLEDVLIDFKGLNVIGAHMGHPYEALLMQYMLKWPDLYLSNSAYLARYMDPAVVSFMDSSRGLGAVLFAVRPSVPAHGTGSGRRPRSASLRPGGPGLSRRGTARAAAAAGRGRQVGETAVARGRRLTALRCPTIPAMNGDGLNRDGSL